MPARSKTLKRKAAAHRPFATLRLCEKTTHTLRAPAPSRETHPHPSRPHPFAPLRLREKPTHTLREKPTHPLRVFFFPLSENKNTLD
jgi:hypothetical protein